VQVEGAQSRRLQHRPRQDLAVGDHHRRVEPEGLEGVDLVRIAHRPRRADRQAQLFGEGLHRRGADLLASPARRRRLGVDGGDLVVRSHQLGQGFHREFGRAEEGQAHAGRFSGALCERKLRAFRDEFLSIRRRR